MGRIICASGAMPFDLANKLCRDKTTINFQYIYHIAFWLLENSTTLQAPNKCQIQID